MAARAHDPGPAMWGTELPLVGRRADIGALRMALDEALEGRGRTLLLTGEPGVGKSRLLAVLAQEARSRHMQVAAGRGFRVEAGVPYGAFADALATPLQSLEPGTLTVLARGAEEELRAIMPAFPGTSADSRRRTVVDADGKARLLWIVTQFLTRLAARQPLLLVLDNAHWADPSSLELLHFIARQIEAYHCCWCWHTPMTRWNHPPCCRMSVGRYWRRARPRCGASNRSRRRIWWSCCNVHSRSRTARRRHTRPCSFATRTAIRSSWRKRSNRWWPRDAFGVGATSGSSRTPRRYICLRPYVMPYTPDWRPSPPSPVASPSSRRWWMVPPHSPCSNAAAVSTPNRWPMRSTSWFTSASSSRKIGGLG